MKHPKQAKIAVTIATIAACLGACASTDRQTGGEVVTGAVQQPFRDLNLIRDSAPPVLVAAAERPYDRAGLVSCEVIFARVHELSEFLGPDIDLEGDEAQWDAVEIASDALRSALGLPFRGVVRRLTGAHERDEQIRRAVLAGFVRRGYLKGLAAERQCGPVPSQPL